jgi:hypothetical protein
VVLLCARETCGDYGDLYCVGVVGDCCEVEGGEGHIVVQGGNVFATHCCSRPSFLHFRLNLSSSDFERAAHLVVGGGGGGCGGVLLATLHVLAGHAGVIDLTGAPVRPTVGTSGGSAWSVCFTDAKVAIWKPGLLAARKLV